LTDPLDMVAEVCNNHAMINLLPTDSYYRGYRLSDNALDHGHVHIYHDADYLGVAADLDAARAQVDEWMMGDDGRA
jgi:hypothetical protein